MSISAPDVTIAALTSLKETGPAVFVMFVLRVLRAPQGDLSLNDTAIPIIPCRISARGTAWYLGNDDHCEYTAKCISCLRQYGKGKASSTKHHTF